MKTPYTCPHWALAYHSHSSNPRAVKWWRIIRVVKADGRWFQLYWHPEASWQSKSRKATRKAAEKGNRDYSGLVLMPGHFRDAPAPRTAGEMQWSLEGIAP